VGERGNKREGRDENKSEKSCFPDVDGAHGVKESKEALATRCGG